MATVAYHTLHSTQTVVLPADVEYNGVIYKAGPHEFDVDGRYWADFDREHPIEGAARTQAWTGVAHALIGELGVGTVTASTLQMGLGLAALFAGIGFTFIIAGLGLRVGHPPRGCEGPRTATGLCAGLMARRPGLSLGARTSDTAGRRGSPIRTSPAARPLPVGSRVSAYGWSSRSRKPITRRSHSIGCSTSARIWRHVGQVPSFHARQCCLLEPWCGEALVASVADDEEELPRAELRDRVAQRPRLGG